MNALERFEAFRKEFLKSCEWKAMVNEVEGTSWHREANVGVHTDMLLSWYKDNLFGQRNDRQRLLTMMACLFHDIGKPSSRLLKAQADGTFRHAYHGHEPRSAHMWIDYAISNIDLTCGILLFDIRDVSNVAFMIEHHLPFGLKKANKRLDLKTAFYKRMGEAGHRAWLDLLLSDQHGRVSDDQTTKLARVDEWLVEWEGVRVE